MKKNVIGPSIWATMYPMIGTKKRMEAGDTFWYNEHRCKVTYVGSQSYSYVHLDCTRDGELPFSVFEDNFRLSKKDGYVSGLHPHFIRNRKEVKPKLRTLTQVIL